MEEKKKKKKRTEDINHRRYPYPMPVVRFGFQEPCNDPQNFCYLWVLHESKNKEQSALPFAVMYDEDPSKINLFVMVFETWECNSDINSCISIIVFDMNQWYKAQMPHQYTIFLFDTKIVFLRVPSAQKSKSILEKIVNDEPSGIPLFDYSGDDLDRENYQKLKHCCQLIQIVRDLFIFIEKNFQALFDRRVALDKKLKQPIDALQLVTKYFAVIIWCLDGSLLPEKVFSSTDKCVPTYTINIMQYTEQKQRKEVQRKPSKKKKKEDPHAIKVHHVTPVSSALFFQYNTQLGPPYHILIDTNFVNFSIKYKLDIIQNMMDCLYAKCIPYVTDCVIGELEKLGQKYKIALKIVRDPRFERIQCMHSGTYADDCLVERITQHKCFIVATCDKDLKRRIRKIPGVPIMYISHRRYTIERMPDAYGAPKT
ncbi:hypothetical protein PGB90_004682 [Kerria lacca]